MFPKASKLQQICITFQVDITYMMLGLANGINGPSMIDVGNIYQSSISVISRVIAFGSGGGLVGGFLGLLKYLLINFKLL